jgi:hypothetical protein
VLGNNRRATALAGCALLCSMVLGGCAPTAIPAASGSQLATAIASGSTTIQPQSAEPPAPSTSLSSVACTGDAAPLPHQAPDVEALLPARVGGRSLARWSLRGGCWLDEVVGKENVAALIAGLEKEAGGRPIDVPNLRYGIAGRSDTKRDPPYFVYGAARPPDDPEISLALYLLLGGAGFRDVTGGGDLSRYQTQEIGGKEVAVGTEAMLDQSEHQRGRPFLYQTEDYMFVIITDDDAWAADALRQLP